MLRLAPAAGWFLASAALLLACTGPDQAAPSKLTETKNIIQPVPPTRRRQDMPSPFVNPNKEPPPPRSEPQLPPDELAATLARAEAARKVNDVLETSIALRACANKIPQSVLCEGELAITLARMPSHRYEADYYLKQAIAGDDPALSADYYRRLGDALGHKGMFDEAITAYERMIARLNEPTANDYNQLAVALQARPPRTAEAAEMLGEAYKLDPTRHEWLRDQAILYAQIPNKIAHAITLFEQFRTKITDKTLIDDTDRRIAELRALIAANTEAPGKTGKKPPKPTP